MRGTGRTIGALATAVVLALAATACSGGDDASGAGGSDRQPAPTTDGSTGTSTTVAADVGPLERYVGYESTEYADDEHWLCRPGRDDICASDLDTTVVAPDGTLTVEPFAPAEDPPVDCFYVYPTISRDPGPVSDWDASDDEEGYAAVNQVARLSARCRVFAPIYRQRTLAALASRVSGSAAPTGDAPDPYVDVLDAWKTYMANDNDGRGVVLVGHSQGSALLGRLIAEEIDPNPDVADRLVAAYLAGWAVAVPDGADVGGAFDTVPLCRSADQTGCVVSWASFRASAPPQPGALFGKPREGDDPAACNSPAALAGGPADVHAYLPADRSASILATVAAGTGTSPWLDPAVGTVTTPFVSVPGLVSAECVSAGGFTYLAVTVNADPADPRADDIGGDLTPDWGLHLVDINLVMGDVLDLVASQTAAWAADGSAGASADGTAGE